MDSKSRFCIFIPHEQTACFVAKKDNQRDHGWDTDI